MKCLIPFCLVMVLTPMLTFGTTIVDDTFSDGNRADTGTPPLQANWWYSTSSTAIEASAGDLGLVTGTSGRGIHGTFASQTLGMGDMLTATFTFTTPATVATAKPDSFKIGLFDTTGHSLAQDIMASSGLPNSLYNNLNGYMLDLDVASTGANIAFYERTNAASGQLMNSLPDFALLNQGGSNYTFTANTVYTGVFSIALTGATTVNLTASLYQGANTSGTLMSTFTTSDATASATSFGMLAFHANASVFGSSATVGAADNGIDFSEIKIDDVTAAPEPSSLALFSGALISLAVWCGRKLSRKSS